MMDFEYLCTKMGDMTGLPIRIYRNNVEVFYYCVVPLDIDPINIYLKDILDSDKHVDYFLTPDFDIYGIVNGDELSIVIGPSISENATIQHLRKKAFDIKVPVNQIDNFVAGLNSLVRMPLNSVLQILCTLNYVINNEKLALDDIQIADTQSTYPAALHNEQDYNRGYIVEKILCEFIRNGDLIGFEEWVKKAPTVKAGKVANDTLRQQRNIFIVSATLFSRNAIEAGMDVGEALQLSDYYIQQCESSSSIDDITSLQFEMLSTYIRKVAEIKEMKVNNYISKKVYQYIMAHLSEPVTTEKLAEHLHMSRAYLSTCFKKETGYDLKKYIMNIKVFQAKQLLKSTNNSMLSISTYLGFSSSSHFARVFISFTGVSPSVYRKS